MASVHLSRLSLMWLLKHATRKQFKGVWVAWSAVMPSIKHSWPRFDVGLRLSRAGNGHRRAQARNDLLHHGGSIHHQRGRSPEQTKAGGDQRCRSVQRHRGSHVEAFSSFVFQCLWNWKKYVIYHLDPWCDDTIPRCSMWHVPVVLGTLCTGGLAWPETDKDRSVKRK